MRGIFKTVVDSMILNVCGKCANKPPAVNWYRSFSGQQPEKKSEIAVKHWIGQNYHISFPIFGRAEITTYESSHVFVLMVNSPGSAVLIRNNIDYAAKTINTLASMTSVWPMLVIIILFSSISGILLWSVVSATSRSQLYT